MKRIGIIKHEKYCPQRHEQLEKIIQVAHDTGHRRDYEIYLDDIKIVPRTSDPAKFQTLTDCVDENSEIATILLFYGASNHYDKFVLYFNGLPNTQASVHQIRESEDQHKERILKEIRFEEFEKENEELKAKLEELAGDFNTQKENWEQNKNLKISSLGEIGFVILMKLLQHPAVKKKFPFFDDILGGTETPDTGSSDIPEENAATFSRKEPEKEAKEKPKEEPNPDQAYVDLIKQIMNSMNEEQFRQMSEIMTLLFHNPAALKSSLKHIHNFLKCRPRTDSDTKNAA